MKKFIIASFVLSVLVGVLPGCLKDERFDNHEYGINDPDTQPPGIGFALGAKSRNDYGLEVSGNPQEVNGLVFVNLNSGSPAPSDITVSIQNNSTAVIDAYNTATGSSVEVLPANLFSVPLSLTIEAGQRFIQVPLTVSNTLSLDPNITYGVGLTITSVTGNYTIAENMKNLFIAFSIKNKYDGTYTLKGQFYHPTASPYTWYTTTVQMHTTGPNSVKIFYPPFDGYYHPWSSGGSITAFGSQEPDYTINPTDNKVTVFNSYPGAVTIYSMGLGFDNLGYDSRWVDASKTMYVCFGYNLGGGGEFNPAASRLWIDTLIRTGPR